MVTWGGAIANHLPRYAVVIENDATNNPAYVPGLPGVQRRVQRSQT